MIRNRKNSSSTFADSDAGTISGIKMEEQESYEKLVRPSGDPVSLRSQLRLPLFDNAYFREKMKLPDNFLGMTLREGTFVTILFLQSVAFTFAAYLWVYITDEGWRKHGYTIWEKKFEDDFNPYMKNDGRAVINALYPLWYDFAKALAITHVIYFTVGLGVCYGVWRTHCHPWVYLPWLLVTGVLVAMCYLSGALMLIAVFYFSFKREISVTWDVVPMICVFLYAIAWTYGFLIVIAHYQRRCIVRYWRKNKRKEFFEDK